MIGTEIEGDYKMWPIFKNHSDKRLMERFNPDENYAYIKY